MDCPDCLDDQHLCIACKLIYWRSEGSLHIDPRATPSRRNRVEPRRANPAWEKGSMSEARPGGTRMPLISDSTFAPIPVKKYGENRRAFETQRRDLAN